MKSLIIVLVVLIMSFLSSCFAAEKFVLLLHSYHQGYRWTDDVQRGVVRQFHLNEEKVKIDYRVEYMNSFDHQGKDYDEVLAKFYKQKYSKAPDLIIAVDNTALSFIKKYRSKIWGEKPVVFCGINNYSEKVFEGLSLATGVIEDIPYAESLKLALDLYPQTKHFFFLYNEAVYKNTIIESLNKLASQFPQVDFQFIANPSFPEVLTTLSKRGNDTAVFLLGLLQDEHKEVLSSSLGTRLLRQNTSVPLYSFSDQYLGEGIIGGRFVNGELHGEKTGELAVKVLAGADINNIPVFRHQGSRFGFDAEELSLRKIPYSRLPKDYYLVHDQFNFFKEYEVSILSISGMIIFLIVASAFLLIYLKDRKKILRRLHEKNERLSSLTSNIPQMALYRAKADFPQAILFVSDTISRLTGFDRAEVHELMRVVHPSDQAFVRAERERQLAKDKSFEIDYRILCRDGSIKYVKEKGQLIESSDGLVIDGVLIDVSLIKKLESEKHQIQNQLFQSARLASVGTLAAGVAHEINNPLAILQGYFDIIRKTLDKRGILDQHLKDYFVTGIQSLERITTIVNGLRVFAKSDLDHYGPVNIHKVIEDTTGLCQPIFQKLNISIVYKLEAPFFLVHGNEGKLQQVIMNLLTNARDGILESERKLQGSIKIETSLQNGNFYLTIEDNGTGIPREYIQRVFDPFFTTKPPGKGIGLGLSIAHSIVELMNGSIKLESIQGRGATASMTLPLSLSIAQDIKNFKIDSTQSKNKSTLKTALIIDDESAMRRVLKSYLEDFGIDVVEASDGKEALECFRSHSFDYAFIDHHMPIMDGVEFLEAFFISEFKQVSTKLYFMTGGFAEEVLTPDLRARIHGHLPKPFTEQDLGRLIKG